MATENVVEPFSDAFFPQRLVLPDSSRIFDEKALFSEERPRSLTMKPQSSLES